VAGKREFWSGRLGFILATMGSAIGLGSIWKFPYEVGTNGGGAFILCYVVGLVLIVFPLMLVEFALGRHGRADAIGSIAVAAQESAASPRWRVVGALGIVTAFLILSFYSVIGGWALAYAVDTVREGLPGSTVDAAKVRFDALLASPGRIAAYHTAFMALTALIVGRGIADGIEAACKILMPILMALLALLSIYATAPGDVAAALRFLCGPGLMFVTLPLAFARLPMGTLAAMAFFVLLATAGLASAISLLEMPVAYLRRHGWRRASATATAASSCWLLGWISVFSFNRWAEWFPLGGLPAFRSATVFDLLDQLTSNMLLPAEGLGLAILAGWVLPASLLADELCLSRTGATLLRVLLRYLVPCAIVLVALASLRIPAPQ
jgi:SNF family Na+-dependent transporter